MRPASITSQAASTEGCLHPGMAAPAFPAAQEAPSTEEKPRKPRGAGQEPVTPKAPLVSPTITCTSSLLQRDTDHVSSQPCMQDSSHGLPGSLNSSQPTEFNVQRCLFSQGHPF